MKRCKTVWSSCCLELLPFKFCNIHRKTSVLVSLFNKFVGLEGCNIIKKSDSDTGVRLRLLWILQTFLRIFFSIENLRWLLLCLLAREKKRKALKKRKKNFSNLLLASFGASYKRNANTTVSILKLTLFLLLFLQIYFLLIPKFSFFVYLFHLANWKMSHVAFISICRSKHWELFFKSADRQDITKIVVFIFCKIGVNFQYGTVY